MVQALAPMAVAARRFAWTDHHECEHQALPVTQADDGRHANRVVRAVPAMRTHPRLSGLAESAKGATQSPVVQVIGTKGAPQNPVVQVIASRGVSVRPGFGPS